MLSHLASHLALRNRALGLVVCTTGSATLAATATGYSRTSGSFLTDGFDVGMEIVPTGFAANTVDIVTAVTAHSLSVQEPRAVEAAHAGRTISVGLPVLRAWENVDFTPVGGRPYVEEEYVPATNRLVTFPASGGQLEETGLFLLKWYGLSAVGISALRTSVDALKALYAPDTVLVAGSNTVRCRSDLGAYCGQIIPIAGGWSVLVLTVPWLARSTNVIAA
jgi:hypothetical protein